MSKVLRRKVYFRITAVGHEDRWRDCVTNAVLEFPAVQAACGEETAAEMR